jgi:modification methylase
LALQTCREKSYRKELQSKDALLTSIWRIAPERVNEHPAPFPIELPLRCLMSVAAPNDIVIDPYCGSGTTLVAAKKLGLKYIGIDISQNYVEMAKKRLEDYASEEKKMDEEIARHTVLKTFKQRKEDKKDRDFEQKNNGIESEDTE